MLYDTTQTSESHDGELQSLLSRLDEAQQTVKQLQIDHRISAIATSASNDELRQADAEKLRAQLESKYGEHLGRVKEQYEARVNRLQMQLTGLHTQLQSMEGSSASSGPRSPPDTATVTSNPNPPRESIAGSGSGSGSGAWNAIRGEGEIRSTVPYENEEKIKESEREKEKENLERRIRQAEARSIALTQQLQSMPSCLQVGCAVNSKM